VPGISPAPIPAVASSVTLGLAQLKCVVELAVLGGCLTIRNRLDANRYLVPMTMTALPIGEISKLRVLSRIQALQSSSPADTTVAALTESFAGELPELKVSIEDALNLLEADELVNLDRRLGYVIAGANLSPAGRARAAEFETARTSSPARRRQARDDYLYWLYEQIEDFDRGPTPDDFLITLPSYLGIAYTPREVEKAGCWLTESRFIGGAAAWQYSAPLRPSLTAKGRFTVENSRSTNDTTQTNGNIYTTTVVGDAVIAQGHSTVTQTTNLSWVIEGNHLLDGIQEALLMLPGEIRDSVTLATEEARDALLGTPDVNRLKKALGAMTGFLAQSTSGALGGLLSAQVLAFLASLP